MIRTEGRVVIGPTGALRVMVATKPVDFRKGADGLAALVRDTMGADPFSGAIYVFRAKRADGSSSSTSTAPACGCWRSAWREVLLACVHRWRGEADGGTAAGAPGRVGLAARA